MLKFALGAATGVACFALALYGAIFLDHGDDRTYLPADFFYDDDDDDDAAAWYGSLYD